MAIKEVGEKRSVAAEAAAEAAADTNNLLEKLVKQQPKMSLQFQCKAKIIKTKITQNNLCMQLGIGSVSSLSRWLNGLTAKMNPAHLVQMNEIMSAWLEDRERNAATAEAEPEEAPLEDTVEDTDDDDSELEV